MQANTLTSFVRTSGAVHAAAGLLLAIAYLTHHHAMTPDTIGSTHWMLVHLAFMGSLLGGIFGVFGLYAANIERVGALGHGGFAAAVTGLFLIGGLAFFETFMAPTLAQEFPAVIETYGAADGMGPVALMFPFAGSLTVLGYASLAGALLRAGSAHRKALVYVIVNALFFGFGLSPLGGLHIAMAGGTLFGLGLVWVGLLTVLQPVRP